MSNLDRQLRLIVECLERHRVSYVVIGGVAAMLQDVPIQETLDVDVVPERKTNPACLIRLCPQQHLVHVARVG